MPHIPPPGEVSFVNTGGGMVSTSKIKDNDGCRSMSTEPKPFASQLSFRKRGPSIHSNPLTQEAATVPFRVWADVIPNISMTFLKE